MSYLEQNSWQNLVRDYGSPLYVYEMETVAKRVQELRSRLPKNANIYYSLKSNPLPAIVNRVFEEGCSLEVTSENELAVACKTGIPRSLLLYGGPGKTDNEFENALNSDVTCFSIESWTDLSRLEKVVQSMDTRARVILRINPEQALSSGLVMSGAPTQFGFEQSILLSGWDQIKHLDSRIDIIGFHIYYGTQMKSTETIIEAATAAIKCVDLICAKVGFIPEVVNLGGGFPWAYAQPQIDTQLGDLSNALNNLIESSPICRKAQLWFESGRYLSASSGTLLTTVLDIKESIENSRFVVVDAGINSLGGMSGIGRLPRGYTFLTTTGDEPTEAKEKAVVVGPLCSPLDCMTRKYPMPINLKVGDLLAIPNVGAYGITASLIAFLTKPPACELVLNQGKFEALYQLRYGHKTLSEL